METLAWDDLRILLAVHRAGSLLGAGKSLGLSTSTIARRLDAIEAAAGEQLVHRGQSGTALRPDAMPLLRLAEAVQHGLDALRRDRKVMAGTLRVSVPDGMAQMFSGLLIAFHHEHPQVDIELVGENRLADVAKREADIAVRLTRSASSVLVEKRLASFRFSLFASADYAQRNLPNRQLRKGEAWRLPFVGLDKQWKGLPHEKWMMELGAGRFVFRSSSIDAITEAVRLGVGMTALLEQDPRTADLVRIDTHLPGPVQPFYLVYHRDLRDTPHVRAAVALIDASMRQLR
jgi:DNA-binding transcriptional LysR family regulator